MSLNSVVGLQGPVVKANDLPKLHCYRWHSTGGSTRIILVHRCCHSVNELTVMHMSGRACRLLHEH